MFSKSEPAITLTWPPDKPALKVTFEKFRAQGSYEGQQSFLAEVTLQNITNKPIPRVAFTVYMFDKAKARIGQGLLQVSDLDPGQLVKTQFSFYAMGIPASLAISAKTDMLGPKTIPLKVISVPSGASLKVDGVDAGMTPVVVRFTVGTHQLKLVKEGYAPGGTSLDVAADELPGGSVSIELGGLSQDTIELRDGSVIEGDVISMSLTQVNVRVDGKDQTYDRNMVKKLILVQREVSISQPVSPAPAAEKPRRP